METKKSREADLEGRRVESFLLGVILVLALGFVALEWNTDADGWTFFDADDELEAELELSPLKREQDEVPMMIPEEQQVEQPKSEELNIVDETVEQEMVEMPPVEDVIEKPEKMAEEEKPQVVDMYDEPVDFRVVEELPQFPGGASEFMKWLTHNLKYPPSAQQRKVKGRVVAQFIVNTDGTVTDLELKERLDGACDQEVLRVLRMMPRWQAGLMNAKPCRTKVCIPVVFGL